MFMISKLIENVQKYGNCSFYMNDDKNKKANRVIEFLVDEDGNLKVNFKMEIYLVGRYWNGFEFSKDSKSQIFSECVLVDGANLITSIAAVMKWSFYENYIGVDADKDYMLAQDGVAFNTDRAVHILYNTACAMLSDFDKQDYHQWFLGSPNAKINLFIKKAANVKNEEITPSLVNSHMEDKMAEFYEKYRVVCEIYNRLKNCESDELEKITQELDSLFDTKKPYTKK